MIVLIAVIGAGFGVGHAAVPPSAATASPLMLYAAAPTASGVRDGRFYLTFPVRASGAALRWVTPTVSPLRGLTSLAVYVVPLSAPGSVPEPMLAARSLDALAASETAMVVITGTCNAVPPPRQPVRVVIEARIGATITAIPVVGTPTLSARDLAAACLPGVRAGARPQA